MPTLLAAASILSTMSSAYADLGDQIAKLLPDDGQARELFGWSVGISGATAVAGAYLGWNNGVINGSAYLFDTTTYRQIIKLRADDGAEGDNFGYSVSINGSIAVVGAYRDDDDGKDSGSAYLFDTTTGQQIAKLLPKDGAAGDEFGYSVALSGDTVIVGAYGRDENGFESGSACLFDISDPAKPVQIAEFLPDDGAAEDHFGVSVAIGGAPGNEIAIVGAFWDDDNCDNSGSAYLFDAAAPGNCPWDLDGDGVVGAGDLILVLGSWGDPYGTADLIELLGAWGPCP